jgi:hypothetical protein
MATTTRAVRVCCIRCHDADAVVTMDLDGTCLFRCGVCDEEFTPDEIREYLAEQASAWGRVLKWVDEYPTDDAAK